MFFCASILSAVLPLNPLDIRVVHLIWCERIRLCSLSGGTELLLECNIVLRALITNITSPHHRIKRLPPILVGIVHHDVNKDGHEERENGGTILNLTAIYTAVPGCATVNELVAQDV